jgi:hypothetical protein
MHAHFNPIIYNLICTSRRSQKDTREREREREREINKVAGLYYDVMYVRHLYVPNQLIIPLRGHFSTAVYKFAIS